MILKVNPDDLLTSQTVCGVVYFAQTIGHMIVDVTLSRGHAEQLKNSLAFDERLWVVDPSIVQQPQSLFERITYRGVKMTVSPWSPESTFTLKPKH